MADQRTVTFPYSPIEHAKALVEADSGRTFRWWMRLGGFVIGGGGLLMAGLSALTGVPIASALQNGMELVALGAFWVWGASPLLTAIEGRQLRRGAGQDSREVDSLTFGADGFSPSLKWPHPMPWSFVDRVIETERFLLIYHGYSKDPFYIPKHAVSEADMERLSALLHANLQSRRRQVQLLSRAS